MARPILNTTWPQEMQPRDWAALLAAIHARCRGTAFGPLACWLWTGPVQTKGYGVCNLTVAGARRTLPHRLVLECQLRRLLAPAELAIHSCHNRRCCNPAHLRVGSARDNFNDMIAAGRWRGPEGPRTVRADHRLRAGTR